MFKVGDIVGVIGGRRGDRYRVISISVADVLILRSIHRTDSSMNFMVNDDGHLELDKTYERKKKIEKICSKLVI